MEATTKDADGHDLRVGDEVMRYCSMLGTYSLGPAEVEKIEGDQVFLVRRRNAWGFEGRYVDGWWYGNACRRVYPCRTDVDQ